MIGLGSQFFGLIGKSLREKGKANNIRCDSCDDENGLRLVWNIAVIFMDCEMYCDFA